MQTLINFTVEVPMIYFIPILVFTIAIVMNKFNL